ncbi:MAG: hypothetical protein ACE5E6_00275 [Phycisphaerae bacterium]
MTHRTWHNTACRRLCTLAVSAVCIYQVGCLPDGREFRDVAGPNVESGVRSVVTGLLDGLFAVIDPDPVGTDVSDPTSP